MSRRRCRLVPRRVNGHTNTGALNPNEEDVEKGLGGESATNRNLFRTLPFLGHDVPSALRALPVTNDPARAGVEGARDVQPLAALDADESVTVVHD